MDNKNFGIVFMGTPDFAVESLKVLYENGFKILAVVTAPDKPAGRGRKIRESTVKKYALSKGLKILQPHNLKSESFISELRNLNADLYVVVAFRMLPEVVWNIPRCGTVNLHASLLPQYRGAAPINHAVINGEKKTGVTTFFIEKEIDTGNIIAQKEVEILPDETAGELHDKLMLAGRELILKTVTDIMNKVVKPIPQSELTTNTEIKSAPKIFKDDCKIEWNQRTDKIYNFIRGLSPYPTAWTILENSQKTLILKIFRADKIIEKHSLIPGEIVSNNKNYLKIATADGFLDVKELQLQGKKPMRVNDLLNGFDILSYKIKHNVSDKN